MQFCPFRSPGEQGSAQHARLLVLVLMGLVHCAICSNALHAQAEPTGTAKPAHQAPRTAAPGHRVFRDLDRLPLPVREMRAHILSAVVSGRIEDLRLAIEWNEISPNFPAGAGTSADEAIAYFKNSSKDGAGLQTLATLGELLDAGFVKQRLGQDVENNLVYVWPYFAVLPLQSLTPAQRVELLRLVTPAQYDAMMGAGRYSGFRLAIGADGTWHEFVQGEQE